MERYADGNSGLEAKSRSHLRTEVAARFLQSHGLEKEARLLHEIRDRCETEVNRIFGNGRRLYPEFALLQGNYLGDGDTRHADTRFDASTNQWVPNHTPQRAVSACIYLNRAGRGTLISLGPHGTQCKPKRADRAMRKSKFNLIMHFAAAFLIVTAAGNENMDDMKERLANPDVSVRRSAARELAVNDPEKIGNHVIPLIQQALKDNDLQVRRLGAAAMHRVLAASVARPEYKSQHGITVDLEKDSELRDSILPTLLAALNDPDIEVRQEVIHALAIGFPLTREIERELLNRLEGEPSPSSRSVIIGYLAKHGSPAAERVILKALDAPEATVRGWAADALTRLDPLPPTALSKLVRELENESSSFARQKFAAAISEYGKEAVQYLPQLRKALVSETNETAQWKLESAINAIEKAAGQ